MARPDLLEDLRVAARFFPRLPGFLRRQVTSAEARATVRARLSSREADFLGLARDLVWANPASPYRMLLAHAGCEPQDLERLVEQDGVDAALATLWRQSVYLTVEEFKGRKPLVRGGRTIPVDPGRLVNPRAVVHVLVEDERPDGRPRVRLLVHPAVGPLDPALAREAFLAALASGSEIHRSMVATWRDAGLVEIERRAPMTEAIGKILHLRTSGPR